MLTPEPFFEPRGTPISVYQRLEALSALGHHVDLVTYHVGKDVSFPNVRIFRVWKVNFIKHVRVGPSRAKILLDVLVFLKALFLLLRKRYDVIHTHEEASFFGAFLAFLFRTRHLYDMHSVLSRQLSKASFGNSPIFVRIFEILERMVLKSCDAVITVGQDLEAHVKSIVPDKRVAMIENIALQAYQKPVQPEEVLELKKKLNLNGRIPIVYAGTYEPYQGFEMVLESIGIVAKQYPEVIFIFVGAKNTQAAFWSEKARQFNVQDHALFLDVVSPEESMVFLAYGTALISPRLEGTSTPLKIYSYLYAEKPIVATNIVAHTQVLNPEIAYLVEPNSAAFAEGIIRVLKNPETAARIGKNAREYAKEKFSRQDYIKKVNIIYQSLQTASEVEEPALLQEK